MLLKVDVTDPGTAERARSIVCALAVLTVMMLGSGCAGSRSPSNSCTAGDTRACQCSGGRSGQQTCSSSSTWGSCVCEPGFKDLSTTDSLVGDSRKPWDGWRPPDGKRDHPASTTDRPPSTPDKPATPCSGALSNMQYSVGGSYTTKSGGQQVDVKLEQVGVSGGAAAAELVLDGDTGNVRILKQAESTTSSAGFVVYAFQVNDTGSSSTSWARICVNR